VASFAFRGTVSAPIETVFDVLTDHRGYAQITPLRSVTLEREGDPAPNGVGAIRRLGLVGPPIREEVTEFDRPTRFVYRLLSGAPVRDYIGTVELAPDGDRKTHVVYRVDTFPVIPLTGRAVVAVARTGVGQLYKAIVKESERRAKAGA
jgi:uncharacterized protein YndB with AHSA1/START domain